MSYLFDSKADHYDSWYHTPSGRVIDLIEKGAVMAYLKPKQGMSVLDIGCGTGNYALDLARRGLRVTGVDESPAMLDKARERAQAEGLQVDFIRGNAIELPFGDDSFDSVVSVTAMEFVSDLEAALQEAYRVLKPGGRLVVGVIGRDSEWGHYYRERASRKKDSVFNHARFYTLEELKNAMPGRLEDARAALFIPPDYDYYREQDALELENSAVRAGRTDGGFVCAVAVK